MGQNYDKPIKASYDRQKKKKRKLHGGVYEYLEDERSEGRAVTNISLQEKAREVAASMSLVGFAASPMWLWRRKRRWNIGRRQATNCSQKVPADYKEQLAHFERVVVRVRELYTLSHIANMDQTMVP